MKISCVHSIQSEDIPKTKDKHVTLYTTAVFQPYIFEWAFMSFVVLKVRVLHKIQTYLQQGCVNSFPIIPYNNPVGVLMFQK